MNAKRRTCRAARVFAATAGTGLAFAGPIAAIAQEQQAGVSAAVRGQILLGGQPNIVGRQIRSGEPIFLGNRITSGADAGMQIVLLDETTFTIGADSEMVIDTFVYDPASKRGQVSASVTKGVFRFVTGQVARAEPRNMQVKVPNATIGIRGTAVWGEVLQNGNSFVALAGPGGGNNTGDPPGGINIITGNDSFPVSRPGFGAQIVPGQPVVIGPVPPQVAQRVLGRLGAPPPPAGGSTAGGAGGGNPTDLAGQSIAGALPGLGDQRSIAEFSGRTNDAATEAIQTVNSIQSTFEDLRSVQTGEFHYYQENVPISGGGTYIFALDINFGSRSVGGGSSFIDVNNGSVFSGSAGLSSQSFNTGSGLASFKFSIPPSSESFSGSACGLGGCGIVFDTKPQNNNGIATQLAHSLTVANSSGGTIGTGSGTASRNVGLFSAP